MLYCMGYTALTSPASLAVSERLSLLELASSILRRCIYFARRFLLSACDGGRLNRLRLTIGGF